MKKIITIIIMAVVLLFSIFWLAQSDNSLVNSLFQKKEYTEIPENSPKDKDSETVWNSDDGKIQLVIDGTDGINSRGLFNGSFQMNGKEYPLYVFIEYDEKFEGAAWCIDSFSIKKDNDYEMLFDAFHTVNEKNNTLEFEIVSEGNYKDLYQKGEKVIFTMQ